MIIEVTSTYAGYGSVLVMIQTIATIEYETINSFKEKTATIYLLNGKSVSTQHSQEHIKELIETAMRSIDNEK